MESQNPEVNINLPDQDSQSKNYKNVRLAIILAFILALIFMIFLFFFGDHRNGKFEIRKDGVVMEIGKSDIINKRDAFQQQVDNMQKLAEQYSENKLLRDSIDKLILERKKDISIANDLAERFSDYNNLDQDKKNKLITELFNFLSKSTNPGIDEDYAYKAHEYADKFLNSEKQDLNSRLAELNRKLEALERENADLKGQYRNKVNELAAMREELEKLKTEQKDGSIGNTQLQARVNTLETQIAESEKEIKVYKDKVDKNQVVITGHTLSLMYDKKVRITPKTGHEYLLRNSKPLTMSVVFNAEFIKDTNNIVLYAACKSPDGKVVDTKDIHIKGVLIQYTQSIVLEKTKNKDLVFQFQFKDNFGYGNYDIDFYTDYSSVSIYHIPIILKKAPRF